MISGKTVRVRPGFEVGFRNVLTSSTILTLIVIPTTYFLVDGLKEKFFKSADEPAGAEAPAAARWIGRAFRPPAPKNPGWQSGLTLQRV
jgi:hypothetical protein